MKLKYEFEAVEIDDEIVCVPIGAEAENLHGVLKLNTTGYEIVNMLKEETTLEQIADVLSQKYETDRQTIYDYVQQTLGTLMSHGLVE